MGLCSAHMRFGQFGFAFEFPINSQHFPTEHTFLVPKLVSVKSSSCPFLKREMPQYYALKTTLRIRPLTNIKGLRLVTRALWTSRTATFLHEFLNRRFSDKIGVCRRVNLQVGLIFLKWYKLKSRQLGCKSTYRCMQAISPGRRHPHDPIFPSLLTIGPSL